MSDMVTIPARLLTLAAWDAPRGSRRRSFRRSPAPRRQVRDAAPVIGGGSLDVPHAISFSLSGLTARRR